MVSATFPQEEVLHVHPCTLPVAVPEHVYICTLSQVIREFMSSLDTTSDSYQGQLSSWTLPRLQATQVHTMYMYIRTYSVTHNLKQHIVEHFQNNFHPYIYMLAYIDICKHVDLYSYTHVYTVITVLIS